MRNYFFTLLLVLCPLMGQAATPVPSYLYSLPDGHVLIEHNPSSSYNTFMAMADTLIRDSTYLLYRQPGIDHSDSAFAFSMEQYDPQWLRWGEDSVLGLGDVHIATIASYTGTGTKRRPLITKNTTNFPNLWNLYGNHIVKMKDNHNSGTFRQYYGRPRPYESPTTVGTSYPSGHAYVSWFTCMSLLYMDADSIIPIINMAFELNFYRVIVNAHWNSDLAAGNKFAALTFPVALRNQEYSALLDSAKHEIAVIRPTATRAYTSPTEHIALLPMSSEILPPVYAPGTLEWKADSVKYDQAFALQSGTRGEMALYDDDLANWMVRFSADSVLDVDLTNTTLFPNLHQLFQISQQMALVDTLISSKAYTAWVMGSILAYADTTHATSILRTALDIAESQCILGHVTASMVERSERMGSLGFAIAMGNPQFRTLVDGVISELAVARSISTQLDTPYTNPQHKYIDHGQVIILSDGQKYSITGKIVE